MATDYIVRLSGQDNLSKTLKNVKQSLNDVGKESSQIEKIQEKFNKIQTSTAPLKRQLRDLKAIMSQMNIDGLSNTTTFEQIAEYAGTVKDSMADANDAISRYADDYMKLSAMAEGFTMITGAASTAVGIMQLFGVENDKVEQAILKVQSVMAALNGVQAIANSLNKDSVLMHRIKQIKIAATTAAETTNTVSTTANTVAVAANTVATNANTAAQRAWNVTKAVAKALLGDWTGLVLVGAGILTTYALCTADSAKADEEKAEATKKATESQSAYHRTLVDTYAQLMGSYQKLRTEWKTLSTEQLKNQWINENKNKLKELGLTVNTVGDAEKAFNNNTDAVVQSFVRRAKAAAKMAVMIELYRKQMELIDKRTSLQASIRADATRNGRFAKAGDEITDETFRSSRYGSVGRDGKWRFSTQGARLYSGASTNGNPQVAAIDREINTLGRLINNLANSIASDTKPWSPSPTSSGGGRYTTPHRTTPHPTKSAKDNTPQPVNGSIAAMEKELQEWQDKLKNGFISTSAESQTIQKIKDLKEKIEAEKIRLGFADPVKTEAEKAAEKYQEDLQNLIDKQGGIQFTPSSSSFDRVVGNNNYNSKTIEGIKAQMDFNDDLIKQLEDLKKTYEELGMMGESSYQNILEQLENVNSQQSRLGSSAKSMKDQTDSFDREKKSLENLADTASSVGNGFSTLSSVFTQTGDSATAAALSIVGSTAQATAEIIPNILKLISAKQGEAMASGTASAAALPFPANIAAIASIVATVVATFGQILSAVGAFADGGIVGGNLHGDKVLARLNGGEMVLNKKQQTRLFKSIESGKFGNSEIASPSTITWRIKGSDLYGTLTNYKNIKNKQGKKLR